MMKPYSLTFKYQTSINDTGFHSTPAYFDFFYDAVKYMDSIRDLTPCKNIQYCHIEHLETKQSWDFLFFFKQ